MSRIRRSPPTTLADPKLLSMVHSIVQKKKVCTDPAFGQWKPKHKSRLESLVAMKELNHKIDGVDDPIHLTVEIEMNDEKDFKFRITSSSVELYFPLFRYDSKGMSHRNRHEPIGNDLVPCPHFHCFDDKGRWHAYRTKVIDEQEIALCDASNALHHFCVEGNIETDIVPSVGNLQSSIPPHGGNFLAEVIF